MATNWIDFLVSLSPVAETVIWAGLAVYLVIVLREPIQNLANRIVDRVGAGDDVSTPILSLKKSKILEKLDVIEMSDPKESFDETSGSLVIGCPVEPVDWKNYRDNIYESSKNIFLVHALAPSKDKGQKYDIFIYLRRHKSDVIDDVEYAEFFLGRYWGNKVFREKAKDGVIGFRTAAYGPFVCVCKLHFYEGEPVMLSRYVDFEMGVD